MEHYQALFEPDPKAGGYVVTFPDFGYGVTQGETKEEAKEMAQDLLILTIGDYIREGKPLPVRRVVAGRSSTRSRLRHCNPPRSTFTSHSWRRG